jgi:hypothetical protein
VFLQVLLGQVFQVALREVDIRVDVDFELLSLHRDIVTQVSGLAIDLEALFQELLLQIVSMLVNSQNSGGHNKTYEVGDIQDVVFCNVGAVDSIAKVLLLLLQTLSAKGLFLLNGFASGL